ncbi:MAG: hypothetical protein HKN23_15035, partial [Verrucomicrobiales bacterium]|nr:hypothetical protein [Verrucomicrobiales bacterium]
MTRFSPVRPFLHAVILLTVSTGFVLAKVELPEWYEGDKPEAFTLGGTVWPEGVLDIPA